MATGLDRVFDHLQHAGGGLAGQDEEGGLEGVLRVVEVAQYAPADAQHHRRVPPHQRREGRLVTVTGEAIQQERVGQVVRGPAAADGADVAQDGLEAVRGHVRVAPGRWADVGHHLTAGWWVGSFTFFTTLSFAFRFAARRNGVMSDL